MDLFGIGAAMRGVANAYFQGARRTGRTTALLASLKDGDRVVFADIRHADHFRRLCLERALQIECVVRMPREIPELCCRERSIGRTVFDHTWLERFYLEQLRDAESLVHEWQRTLSAEEAKPVNSLRRRIEPMGFGY